MILTTRNQAILPPRHQDTKNVRTFVPIPEDLDRLAQVVVDCAFKVHKALGPGLLESVYEVCLAHEITKSGFALERQVALPVVYDGVRLDAGLRLDILVESKLIVEVKAVEQMLRVFDAQLLSYLKLTGCRLGILINFNVPVIREGIKRIAL